jgi:hypothetical protein
MELDDNNSNLTSISDMLSSQLNAEVVLLDSKFLKVCDNDVTNKKTWWSSSKKNYVVTLDDFEVIFTT